MAEYKLGCDTDTGPLGLYVTNTGFAYLLINGQYCAAEIIVIDSSGQIAWRVCPPGHHTHYIGSALPDGEYICFSRSERGLFQIINNTCEIKYFGNPNDYWKKRSDDVPFSNFSSGREKLFYFGDEDVNVINYAKRKGLNDDCNSYIGVFTYNYNSDEITNHAMFEFMEDENIILTGLEYNNRIRIRYLNDRHVEVYAGYRDQNDSIKMCYFVMDKNLNLLEPKSKAIAAKATDREIPLDRLEYQLMFFQRLPKQDERYSGRLKYYQITKDTIFHSASEPILSNYRARK